MGRWGTCSPGPPPSNPSSLFFLMPFCYIPGLESNVRLTLLTMPYDPTFAGRANPFLTTSSLPVLNKSNTADSVTSQERGLDLLLHKLYLKWTLDVAQQPVTQQQLLSTFTTLPTLRSSVLDLRGTATSHLAQRGDASLHLLLLTHACANMHTEARTNMDDPAHRSTHTQTLRDWVFVFLRQGFLLRARLAWNSLEVSLALNSKHPSCLSCQLLGFQV